MLTPSLIIPDNLIGDFEVLFRILTACFLGGLIGWERERHRNIVSAGIRTYGAISLGACAFGILSTVLDAGATCGHLVQADIPCEVGHEKYDAAFKAVLVLQKYYVAVPFNRQKYFQSLLQMPLPVSTQWQLIEEVGGIVLPVFQVLERKAANGDIIHNDDSHLKITDLIRLNRTNPPK